MGKIKIAMAIRMKQKKLREGLRDAAANGFRWSRMLTGQKENAKRRGER